MWQLLVNLLLFGTYTLRVCGSNLLGNGDLEGDTLGTHWSKSECSWVISTTEKHDGSQSVLITNRKAKWAGIGYNLGLSDGITSGHIYAFSGFIKLENLTSGLLYHDVIIKETYNDHSVLFKVLSRQPRIGLGSWVEKGGVSSFQVIEQKEANYFFDDGSLVELIPDPDWRATAENNIDLNRKVKLDIITCKAKGISLRDFTMEVEQRRSEFGHGTAVRANLWTDAAYSFYRDFVYNTLKSEWAVIENALTWRGMEWNKGYLNFDDANATIDDLLSNGLSVRGHNMFWGVEQWIQSWVQSITDKDVMLKKIQDRISQTISLTRGRLAHWDVNNEALNDDFYERTTENVNITMDMFRAMNTAEPGSQLFLNDFDVASSAQYTTAITNQAKSFLAAQVPVNGVGIQSHLLSSDINITQLKYRLDKVAEAGLPIWVTEMSVTDTNVTAKAQALRTPSPCTSATRR